MEPCGGGRQKLGQRHSGAATVSAVQVWSPVYSCCYVMVAVVLCAEKIHRKLFLNCGGETRQRGEQVQGGRHNS